MGKEIYFLSFYTTGDGAPDLTHVANEVKEKLSKYFTEMFIYNKETLKQLPNSEDICNVFEEPTDMTYFPYAHKMGYYDWKAFLIDYTLKNIPENSILLYHDINFEKYPNYWQSDWENIYDVCDGFLKENESDIWAKFELHDFYLKKSMKTYAIDKVFTDPIQNDVVKNSLQINSSQVVLKNTSFSKEFAKDWLYFTRDWDITHPSPNPNRHPESEIIGCPDQDSMQCALYQRIFDGRLKPTFPIYGLHWRVMRTDTIVFNMKGMECKTGPYRLENKAVINYFKNKTNEEVF
jgi:hypothetical protein